MVPSNENTQNAKPLSPTHHHQPCSSSISPPPPRDATSHDAEIARQLQLTETDNFLTLLDDPNPELPDPTHHGPSTSTGSSGIGGEVLLKRAIDDTSAYYLGLLPPDEYASVKRSRISFNFFFGDDDDDPKGKKPLSAIEEEEEEENDSDTDTCHVQRKDPPVEIDFFAIPPRRDESSSSESENDDDREEPDVDRHAENALWRQSRENSHRIAAQRSASHFARFIPDAAQDDVGPSSSQLEHEFDVSTPFSVAMRAVKARAATVKKSITAEWVSKRKPEEARIPVPSLVELSLKVLANHADAIVSLDGVPDELRHRLCRLLCDSRKMNGHVLELLVSGSPTDIRLNDCSGITEEQFIRAFQTCDTARLEVLQLDQCGRCITDHTVVATLAKSPRCLPRLTTLSLSGACGLSDKGFYDLVSSDPVLRSLRSINLSHCSLLTPLSLHFLAGSLGSRLKELRLDNWVMDAAEIMPALRCFEHLEVLSLTGIDVNDENIEDCIITCGQSLKELVLKNCIKLSDASMKVIAERCPGLHVLDLSSLYKLTDLSIGYLTNNCRALHTLKLCRNLFSDEAIAAFLEITGESLKELSLNSVKKVGPQTALSLASHAKNLHTLDLSWCRNLTDNELGLIVDSCCSLRLLKLFGCTEVTDFFLNGHSNIEIQILGTKMSPLLQHVRVPDPYQGALRYSSVSANSDVD